jgi:hypothetical protein
MNENPSTFFIFCEDFLEERVSANHSFSSTKFYVTTDGALSTQPLFQTLFQRKGGER